MNSNMTLRLRFGGGVLLFLLAAVPEASFEAYVVAGLDGTGFDALSGIRGGRILERPGLDHPAFTGRVDLYPFARGEVGAGRHLRLGASTWFGGADNGDRDREAGIDASVRLFSADFEYVVGAFDFRGAGAWISVDGAREIGGGTASAILGGYVEGAVHVLPPAFREGAFPVTDLVLFVRFDDLDTQFRMPRGVRDDPRGRRWELTLGVGLCLRPNLVAKADVQFRHDRSGRGLPTLLNLGVGWQF